MIDTASLFPTLVRVASPLRAGWCWWAREMAAMLRPARGFGSRRVTVVAVGPDGAVPDVDGGGPVELRLPAAIALRTVLTLPAAAEGNLREVLAFEMDRETPFHADAVRFDARIVGRSERQIRVEMLAVPRAPADRALAAAAARSLAVARLTVEAPQATAFDLRPPENRPRAARSSRLLVGVTAVLALAALATQPLLNLWRAERLDALIGPAQENAALAMRLRGELERRSGAALALDEQKAGRPLALAVLAEVSAGLPDGVWLDQFRLSGGELRLIGYAPAAADLLPLVDALPLLGQVRFETGVVQDPIRKRERFQLRAVVHGSRPAAEERP